MNIFQLPNVLKDSRFKFVKIGKKSKEAIEKYIAENKVHNFEIIESWIEQGYNYGFFCTNGYLVVDADLYMMECFIERDLPKTFTVKTPEKGAHYYFYCPEFVERFKNNSYFELSSDDENGKKLHAGEIRFNGCYCLGPGSIHPDHPEIDDERYEVEQDMPIATVSADELLNVLSSFLNLSDLIENNEDVSHSIGLLEADMRIKDVADKYKLTLKKNGQNLQGSHPLHGSTTGMNFCVNPNENSWFCFRDNKGGGPLSLVSMLEKITPCEAPIPKGKNFEAAVAKARELGFHVLTFEEQDTKAFEVACKAEERHNEALRGLSLGEPSTAFKRRVVMLDFGYEEVDPICTIENSELPYSLSEFLKLQIPPVQHVVDCVLQREGRTMVSASMNAGKSFFLQNLALAISNGSEKFLSKFKITPARCLYLDFEGGQSSIQGRFKKMYENLESHNDKLFIQCEQNFNFLDENDQRKLEFWLSSLKIEVLLIDTIGSSWIGDEKDKQEVDKLTRYLDKIKNKYKTAIVLAHHWRKKTRDFKRGGEMASGSYRWGAWLDHHITLDGDRHSLVVSCEKARNQVKFDPFRVKLTDGLTFEFLNDFERKFDNTTLVNLFNLFGQDRVKVVDLCKRAKKDKICSEDTVRALIKETKTFDMDTTDKAHVVCKKSSEHPKDGVPDDLH